MAASVLSNRVSRSQSNSSAPEVITSREHPAANFLFVTTSRMPCKQIFERLRQKGVLIRYFSAPRLSDYLRITIGTPEQMQRFFEELDLILG